MSIRTRRRRASTRVATAQPISFRRFRESGFPDSLGTGITVDLSEGGAKVRTYYPVPVSARLGLNLNVGDKFVNSKARVVHVTAENDEHFLIGMSFESMSDGDRRILRDLLARFQ
jgi:c-di-GMP-binding flagellar brake protein YcgR